MLNMNLYSLLKIIAPEWRHFQNATTVVRLVVASTGYGVIVESFEKF